MRKLVLASTSFSRKELLKWLDIQFETVVPDFDEEVISPSDFGDVREFVQALSYGKALSVMDQFLDQDVVVLSADSVAYLRPEVYGKPKDLSEAKRVLSRLFGQTHQVFTSYTIFDAQKRTYLCRLVETRVTFRFVAEHELITYINTSESLGKAGGYSVRGHARKFVEKIEGSMTNVIGLPLIEVAQDLKHYGVGVPANVQERILQYLQVES